tara:strand:- start:4882 stop:5838 length:957 start_codon:yes stop_codon:yes gene_type:complete
MTRVLPALLVLFFSISSYSKSFNQKVLFWKDYSFAVNDPWVFLSTNDQERFQILLDFLGRSEFGKKLISDSKKKAKEFSDDKEFLEFFKKGKTSITDTTLSRHFPPSDPQDISYTSSSMIYLDEDLSIEDAILDLAHELTHFSKRPTTNPYSEYFDLEFYIESTILGQGGESEAFISECMVMRDLFLDRFNQDKNCLNLNAAESGSLTQRVIARKLFFKLGKHAGEFRKSLSKHNLPGDHFPHTESTGPVFISSNYDLPYPVAAVAEYESIMKRVCKNDKRRLGYLKKRMNETVNRSPASITFHREQSKLLRRCKYFL